MCWKPTSLMALLGLQSDSDGEEEAGEGRYVSTRFLSRKLHESHFNSGRTLRDSRNLLEV